jgi:multidrug efflux pump subunit AcrA (membrane-fusion protein)
MRTLLLAALLLSGCRAPLDDAGQVPTFEIGESEPFVRRLRAEGVLRAVESTPVTAPQDADGPLTIGWLAEDGSTVAAGDVVVRFDPTTMQRELADSEADVATDEHRIDKVAVDSAATRGKRERTADLAQHEVEVAHEFDTTDTKILSRIEIAENAIDVELAEAKAAHAGRVKGVERSVASNQLDVHRIAKGHHSQAVEHARKGLERLDVIAPHAGVLVLRRGWEGEVVRVGDTVWAGLKIAELPHIDALQAEVFVLEIDAADLVVGLSAEVVIDAHPEVTWKAKVARVDTLAQPKHPEVPVNYFGVTLELERTDVELMRVGQRVQAIISIAQPAAITVPRQAVFDRDGKSIVYRVGDRGFDEVEVVLGRASAGRVVVERGLASGDRIALRDPAKKAAELVGGQDDPPASAGGPR